MTDNNIINVLIYGDLSFDCFSVGHISPASCVTEYKIGLYDIIYQLHRGSQFNKKFMDTLQSVSNSYPIHIIAKMNIGDVHIIYRVCKKISVLKKYLSLYETDCVIYCSYYKNSFSRFNNGRIFCYDTYNAKTVYDTLSERQDVLFLLVADDELIKCTKSWSKKDRLCIYKQSADFIKEINHGELLQHIIHNMYEGKIRYEGCRMDIGPYNPALRYISTYKYMRYFTREEEEELRSKGKSIVKSINDIYNIKNFSSAFIFVNSLSKFNKLLTNPIKFANYLRTEFLDIPPIFVDPLSIDE